MAIERNFQCENSRRENQDNDKQPAVFWNIWFDKLLNEICTRKGKKIEEIESNKSFGGGSSIPNFILPTPAIVYEDQTSNKN